MGYTNCNSQTNSDVSSDARISTILALANEFQIRVGVLDNQAKGIHDKYKINHDPNTVEELRSLNREKDLIMSELMASLHQRLIAKDMESVQQIMDTNFKRKVKMVPEEDEDTSSSIQTDNSYLDEWTDGLNIIGTGVTEGSYTHGYYIYMRMDIPNGDYFEGANDESVGYSSMDLTVGAETGTQGSYIASSEHFTNCNLEGPPSWDSVGSFSLTGVLGYSRLCYDYDSYDPSLVNPYIYKIQEACKSRVTCWNTYLYSVYYSGKHTRSAQGYFINPVTGTKTCLIVQTPLFLVVLQMIAVIQIRNRVL